jgi:peroxiredoxin
LAEYRDAYADIQQAGAGVAAVSVDEMAKSEAVRLLLSLPFPILCDTGHSVIREWGIYDREKGGIAKPAVFLIDANGVVRFATVDPVLKRVPASQMVAVLRSTTEAPAVRRKFLAPTFPEWKTALRNFFAR